MPTRRREECIRQGNAQCPSASDDPRALVEEGASNSERSGAASSASPRESRPPTAQHARTRRSVDRVLVVLAVVALVCHFQLSSSNTQVGTAPKDTRSPERSRSGCSCRRRPVGDDHAAVVHSHVEVENTYCGDWPSGHEGGARRSEPSRPRAPSPGRLDHRDLVGCAVGAPQDTVIAEGGASLGEEGVVESVAGPAGVGVRSGDDAAAPARRGRNGSSRRHTSFVHALGRIGALRLHGDLHPFPAAPRSIPARSESKRHRQSQRALEALKEKEALHGGGVVAACKGVPGACVAVPRQRPQKRRSARLVALTRPS